MALEHLDFNGSRSYQLLFRFETVYASNATVGYGSRNRVMVFCEAAFASEKKIGELTGEVTGKVADTFPT